MIDLDIFRLCLRVTLRQVRPLYDNMEKGIRIIQSSVLGRSQLGQSGPGSQSQINYEKELENATLKAAASCRETGKGEGEKQIFGQWEQGKRFRRGRSK